MKALKRGDRIRKCDKRQSRNKLTGIRTNHAQRTVTAEKCTDNKSDAAQKDQKIQCGLKSLIQLDILFGLFRTIRTSHLKRARAHLYLSRLFRQITAAVYAFFLHNGPLLQNLFLSVGLECLQHRVDLLVIQQLRLLTGCLTIIIKLCEEAMRATAVLQEKGVAVQHMHVSTLKPFTDPTIVEAIKKSKYGVVTIENHLDLGGLGSAVADVIAENGLGKRLVKIGLPGYPHGASKMYLMKKYGIDAMHLVSAVEDLTGKKLGGCPPDRVATLQPAIRDYDCAAYLSDFTYLTQPYAGVCETLAELNRRGIKNAVLTNKPNAVACALIDRFFGDAMELCVGQTPETISKPDPHSMDPVLEQLGIPREQILYVGDTDVDMQTARNTQTAAAAAAWGYQPLEMLLPYHPEFIVRRPEQLLTIF